MTSKTQLSTPKLRHSLSWKALANTDVDCVLREWSLKKISKIPKKKKNTIAPHASYSQSKPERGRRRGKKTTTHHKHTLHHTPPGVGLTFTLVKPIDQRWCQDQHSQQLHSHFHFGASFPFPGRRLRQPWRLHRTSHRQTRTPLTASHGEEIVEGFHSFVSAFIPQHEKGNHAKASYKKIRPWAFCHDLRNNKADNRNRIRLKWHPWSCIFKSTAARATGRRRGKKTVLPWTCRIITKGINNLTLVLAQNETGNWQRSLGTYFCSHFCQEFLQIHDSLHQT